MVVVHFVNTLDVFKSAAYPAYCIAISAPARDIMASDRKLSYLEIIRTNVIHYSTIKRKAIWNGDERVLKEIRLDGLGHWPKHTSTQKRCAVAHCKGRSFYIFEKFNVGLCLSSDEDCYKTYHSIE